MTVLVQTFTKGIPSHIYMYIYIPLYLDPSAVGPAVYVANGYYPLPANNMVIIWTHSNFYVFVSFKCVLLTFFFLCSIMILLQSTGNHWL